MPVTGDFRTILHQMKELKESLKNIEAVSDAVTVVDGNLTIFGDELFKRLASTEERLIQKIDSVIQPLEDKITSLETKITEICADSWESDTACTPPSAKRRKIRRNPDLSHHVRSKLSTLDLSWDTNKQVTDPENQVVFSRLLREVSEVEDVKNNELCNERRIKDAITSTYKTAKKRDKRMEKGGEEEYKKKQRNMQRMDRKLKRRVQSMNNEEKESEKAKAIHMSLMSSDESGDDDSLITRPLPWRNEDISVFFKDLDERYVSCLNPTQRRMMARRSEGIDSERTAVNVPQSLKFWVMD